MNRWIGAGRRRTILNNLGECWGKAPCFYTPHSKCWLGPKMCPGKMRCQKVNCLRKNHWIQGSVLHRGWSSHGTQVKMTRKKLCPMSTKSLPENVCRWGEVPLPDSSDGSLQGGDHVFNEEVIPIAPVFCHGIACPSICEEDVYVNLIHHKWKIWKTTVEPEPPGHILVTSHCGPQLWHHLSFLSIPTLRYRSLSQSYD